MTKIFFANSTLLTKGGKKRNVPDHMNFGRGEAEGELHVIWGISYFTSRGMYTVFLTDVGRKLEKIFSYKQ